MEVKQRWENGRVEGVNLQHCHFSSHEPGGRKSRAKKEVWELEGCLPAGKMEEKRGEDASDGREKEENVVCSVSCVSKGRSLSGGDEQEEER